MVLCGQSIFLYAQENLPEAYYLHDLKGYCFLRPKSVPASGIELQIFDSKNRLVARTLVREDGSFLFPDIVQQDRLRLKAATTQAGIRLLIGNDTEKQKLCLLSDPEGNFLYRQFDPQLLSALLSDTTRKIYGQLLSEKGIEQAATHIEIKLTDRQGKILQRSHTESEGFFTFENLPSDMNFLLQSDASKLYTLLLFSKEGYVIAELQSDENGFYTYIRLPEAYSSRNWQARASLPPDIPPTLAFSGKFDQNLKIPFRISDENGQTLYNDTSDAEGFFRAIHLPLQQRYVIHTHSDDPLKVALKRPLNHEITVLHPDRAGRFIYSPWGEKRNRPSLLADETIGFAEKLYLIYFEKEKSSLSAETLAVLDKIAGLLKSDPTLKLSVEAHADTRGAAEYNRRLSQQRAEIVSHYLHSKGIDAQRIRSIAYGDTQPVVPCSETEPCTEENHIANRRCELKIYR